MPIQHHDDLLKVTVEPFFEWAVDQTEFAGKVPDIEGVTYVPDLAPFIERKLFTVNTGHAMAAYAGYKKGLKTIKDAIHPGENFLAKMSAASDHILASYNI